MKSVPAAPTQKYYIAAANIRDTPAIALVGMVLCLAWFYLMPAPLLDLPGLLGFVALAWLRLDLALCLLPLTFPFWYVPKPVDGSHVFPLSEIALACCCAVFLARSGRWVWLAARGEGLGERVRHAAVGTQRQARRLGAVVLRRVGRGVAVGALLFALGGLIGVVIARRPGDALRAYRWEVVEPLLYLALVVWVVRGRGRTGRTRVLLWSFLGSALVVAVLTYAQVGWLHQTFSPLATGNHLTAMPTSGLDARATGMIYGSGNSLGAWMERALPLALAVALAGRGLPLRGRVLALAAGVLCVPPLLWSASRGAEVGALAGCLLIVIVVAIRPIVSIVLGGGAALLLLLWKHDAILDAALHGHGNTGEVRILIWLAALHMLRDHPIFGIGPDQFQYYYSGRYTKSPYWITHYQGHPTSLALDPTLSHPHNLILDLWLSTGLIGLVGFAVVVVALARRVVRLWRTSQVGPWPAALAVGAGGALLAGLVHSMVDSGYFEPDLALFFWWAVAFLVTLERAARARI